MKVVFVCNKYSPAHSYSIESYNFVLKSNGITSYILNDFFINGDFSKQLDIESISLNDLKNDRDNIVFFFVSPNINNIKTIKKIKRSIKDAKFIYLYHEPINATVKRELIKDRGFSIKTIKFIVGLSLFNGKRLIKEFDHVVLPSKNANDIYEKVRFFRKKSHSIIHLQFLSHSLSSSSNNRYFLSYIGTIAENHGFEEFVNYLLSSSVPGDLKVLIATSSVLDEDVVKKLINKFGERITIQHGSFMSDETISEYYQKTKILWLGYKHSAQSGVLPMSFMYGTPVICSKISSFNEFAKDGINCEYIDIQNHNSINNAIDKILESFEKYQNGCADTYNVFFNPINNTEKIMRVFLDLSKNDEKQL